MNKTQLLGRLTKDIELKETTNSTVGRFTLAVPRMKGEETDFIACKVWGKKAEILEKFVKKGHKLCIAGRLETGSYEKDGRKVYTTEVVVEDFDFIESKPKTEATNESPAEEWTPVFNDPDLPF